MIEWYGDEILQAVAALKDDAMFAAGEVLIANATAKAPRDQGTLQESGYVATADKSTYKKRPHHKNEVRPRGEGVAVAAFSAPHAHLVEHGTSRMRAQPFFRPAFDESKGAMAEAGTGVLKKGLGE
ncbi:MAG TPA: HK97 gp10 family phage protein [Candidatus Competibacter phosphatis]|nr:HK97 gp10 family phage protein [Candidatus Competibacter phosphatis]